MVIYIYIWS